MKRFAGFTVLLLMSLASLAHGQDMPPAYKQVLDTLGKTGDFKDNVLKVNIPRNDLSITVANVKTPTPFGFGGWVAMTKGTGGMDVMMGDLVLTQDEVNPSGTNRGCSTCMSMVTAVRPNWRARSSRRSI